MTLFIIPQHVAQMKRLSVFLDRYQAKMLLVNVVPITFIKFQNTVEKQNFRSVVLPLNSSSKFNTFLSLDTEKCSSNASAPCSNTVGSFTCPCSRRYVGSSRSCSDMQLCSFFSHFIS